MKIEIWMFEIVLYLLGAAVFLLGRKIYGGRETAFFLMGVAIVAGVNEHINCFVGYYNYYWQLGRDLDYFSNYGQSLGGNWLWIGLLPGYFFPGWFYACLSTYTIVRILLPRASAIVTAVATASQVVLIGLAAENLGQVNQWWQYTSAGWTLTLWDGVWAGVFVYYFLWISSFVFVFHRTIVEKGDIAILRGIEPRRANPPGDLGTYGVRLLAAALLSSAMVQLIDFAILRGIGVA